MNSISEITHDGVTYDLSEVETSYFKASEDGEILAYRCPVCEEWFSAEYWENYCSYGNLSEESLCEGCYLSDTNYPSTLLRFTDEGVEKVLFGDHTGYGMAEDYTDEPFDWFFDLFEEWTGRAYHHSSGWRGYFCTERKFDGITVLDDGWMTGDWGDVPWKRDMHSFLEALSGGTLVPPAPLYVMFEPTSNVFSTATTIFARNEDVEVLTAWLNLQPYDTHLALS